MDIDPLSDNAPPPRHALESDTDDEDEDIAGAKGTVKKTAHIPRIAFPLNEPRPTEKVLIVFGEACRHWKMNFNLSSNSWSSLGKITSDQDEIGEIFYNSRAAMCILLCAGSVKLPFAGYRAFADEVLKHLTPVRISVLDSYPLPSYTGIGESEHVIRYLSTQDAPIIGLPGRDLAPYSPPNLICTPTASILSLTAIQAAREATRSTSVASAILLPARHIPSPPNLGPVLEEEWEASLLNLASTYVISVLGFKDSGAIGIEKSQSNQQQVRSTDSRKDRQRGSIGEGGMYL